MLAELDDRDWAEAFWFAWRPAIACAHVTGHTDPDHPCVRGISTAGFEREAVVSVIALSEGRPHAAAWLGVFELADGRFAALRASCCGVGWHCHREGSSAVARSVEDVLRHALSPEERARLGVG